MGFQAWKRLKPYDVAHNLLSKLGHFGKEKDITNTDARIIEKNQDA